MKDISREVIKENIFLKEKVSTKFNHFRGTFSFQKKKKNLIAHLT